MLKKQGRHIHLSESDLGQYVDRLLANKIVSLAQKHKAGSIVVSAMKGLRESLESEITSRIDCLPLLPQQVPINLDMG